MGERMISWKDQQKCKQLTDYCHSHSPKDRGVDGDTTMATLKEEAIKYEAPTTLNIADLDKIPVSLELKEGKGKDKEGEEFTYKYATFEGKDYRVAGSILGGVKALLNKMPNLEYFTVLKQGTGMNTRYQVIPYYENCK